jgi:hypothetical protein
MVTMSLFGFVLVVTIVLLVMKPWPVQDVDYSSNFLNSSAPFVPPKPNEFDRA